MRPEALSVLFACAAATAAAEVVRPVEAPGPGRNDLDKVDGHRNGRFAEVDPQGTEPLCPFRIRGRVVAKDPVERAANR